MRRSTHVRRIIQVPVRCLSSLPAAAAAVALLIGHAAVAAKSLPDASSEAPVAVTVATVTELRAALDSHAAAREVRLRPGRYVLDAPLLIPDHTRMVGSGVLRIDDGLPSEWVGADTTTIVASGVLRGDVVTLGDDVVLEGLRIESAADPVSLPRGNLIALVSRQPGDLLSAKLINCELVNYGDFGVGQEGPAGRAIAVFSRDSRAVGGDAGSRLSLLIDTSVVRNSGATNSLFAVNFASRSTITLDVSHSILEGQLVVAGAASRPQRVVESRTALRSRHNLYRYAGGNAPRGWVVFGGSVGAHAPYIGDGAERNSALVDSEGDRLEGFREAVVAAGARGLHGKGGSVQYNVAELLLRSLRIRTSGEGASDLSLYGALEEAGDSAAGDTAPAYDGNRLLLRLQDSSGSGPRANVYADEPPQAEASGDASDRPNRLEIAGSRAEFSQSNRDFNPSPGTGFFAK